VGVDGEHGHEMGRGVLPPRVGEGVDVSTHFSECADPEIRFPNSHTGGLVGVVPCTTWGYHYPCHLERPAYAGVLRVIFVGFRL